MITKWNNGLAIWPKLELGRLWFPSQLGGHVGIPCDPPLEEMLMRSRRPLVAIALALTLTATAPGKLR